MSAKNRIENTTRIATENPARALVEYGMVPRGIEASERRGQEQLLQSTVLPTEGSDGEEFAALGFKFGPKVEGDELFREATLPDGWKKEGSDHDMWSYIVDERGIHRVSVFYKAAFYDRRAFMRTTRAGWEVGTEAVYGEKEPTAETMKWALLTTGERGDLISFLAEKNGSMDLTQ